MATPKQIVYLRYLGESSPEALSVKEASALIERWHALGETDMEVASRIYDWSTDRVFLYPELYPDKRVDVIVAMNGQAYRSYVRARHRQGSRRLTADIVREVVAAALADPARRHLTDVPSHVFYELLRAMYPDCVDGPSPAPRSRRPPPPLPEEIGDAAFAAEIRQTTAEIKRFSAGLRKSMARRRPRRRRGCLGVFAGIAVLLFALWIAILFARGCVEAARTVGSSGGTLPPADRPRSPVPELVPPRLPTGMRTLRSEDGRELTGQVIARDAAAGTVAIRREDGIVFRDYPVEKLSPGDRAWVETLPEGTGKR